MASMNGGWQASSQPLALGGDKYPSLNYADIAAAIEKRLFLGKVPPGTSDDEISAIFSTFGTLKECRVVPDRSSSGNGIAFVSFDTWSAAHRAMIETDGKAQLRGHEGTASTLVASFAERKNNVGRGGGIAYAKGLDIARVFVGSLPEYTTEADLAARFGCVGTVEGATMLPAKARLRCGYVNFQIWGEALDAVELLHGQPMRDEHEPMTVVLAQPKERDGGLTSTLPSSVAGTPRGGAAPAHVPPPLAPRRVPAPASYGGAAVSEPHAKWRRVGEPAAAAGSSELINSLLTAYVAAVNGSGPATACDLIHDQIMKTRETMQPVNLSDGRMRSAVVAPPSVVNPPGSCGSVGIVAGGGDPDKARLFVGGLPHDITDEDLMSLASQLSFQTLPPESCKLLECRVLPGKGCGYLRYATWEAAEEAFAALQGRQVEGWTQVLRLQWASPRPASGRSQWGSANDTAQPSPSPPVADPQTLPGTQQGPLDPMAYATQAEVEAQGLDPTRLFIGQMARECDAGGALKPLFEQYGALQEFRHVMDKGVLYVAYSTFEEAQGAMQGMGNRSVPGVSMGLNVQFSKRQRRF